MNNTESRKEYSAFWPLLLVCVSICLLLGWNLYAAIQQHSGGVRIRTQQNEQMVQAVEVEGRLRALMAGLIALGENDADAERIQRKFKISITPPTTQPLALAQPGAPLMEAPVVAAPQPEVEVPEVAVPEPEEE